MKNLIQAAVVTLFAASTAQAQQASIKTLGDGVVQSVSADGSLLAGYRAGAGSGRAVRWSSSGTFETVCEVDGSVAYGISGNGQVTTGVFTANGAYHAFRWSPEGGLSDLGYPAGQINAWGVAANADGSVIVGVANAGDPAIARAFRWTAEFGMQDLGVLPGFNSSRSWAVSADGQVVVGECDANPPLQVASCAFRWTAATGMQCLPPTPGSATSAALAISADGKVIAGFSGNGSELHAVRWTEACGPQDLGVLPGFTGSYASAISADGSVLVGWSFNSIRSFRWTAKSGMVDLQLYLASKGAGMAGWQQLVVWPVSSDGTTYAGSGIFQNHTQSFVAIGPSACPADLTDDQTVNGADLGVLLSQWGQGCFASGDLNNDGTVDGADLGFLLANWGPCP